MPLTIFSNIEVLLKFLARWKRGKSREKSSKALAWLAMGQSSVCYTLENERRLFWLLGQRVELGSCPTHPWLGLRWSLPEKLEGEVWRVHFCLSDSQSIFHKLWLRQVSGCGLNPTCLHFCSRRPLWLAAEGEICFAHNLIQGLVTEFAPPQTRGINTLSSNLTFVWSLAGMLLCEPC